MSLDAVPSRGTPRYYLYAWYWAARPFTLTAGLVPVLVGSALAFREGRADPLLFAMVLLGSLLVQIGANLVDEYADHDRPERGHKLLAPYKVIARGLLSPRAVRWGAVVAFSAASAIGVYLTAVAGWLIAAIALASLAAAYFYSAGPKPLGKLGLGQPLVFVFMGPVMVVGTYYVYARAVTPEAVLLSLPVACLVTAILAANDLRDMEEDRAAGKATPVTLFGRPFGRIAWTALVAATFALAVALVATGREGRWALLPVVTLPLAVRAAPVVWLGRDRPSLMPALRRTAALHGWFGVLLALGVALG